MDRRVADDDVMLGVTQVNRTNKWHKRITQNKITSLSRIEMTNDAFRCSRATQVHMEDLRPVNLTEICPRGRFGHFKAPCKSSGWIKTRVDNQTKITDDRKLTIAW